MEAAEKLEQEFSQLQNEAKNIKKRARENYLEQVSDISEKIKQLGDNAGEKAKQVLDNVGDYITKNPQKASLIGLGVGVGVGLILGLLIKSKKD
jgi:ElaB protein